MDILLNYILEVRPEHATLPLAKHTLIYLISALECAYRNRIRKRPLQAIRKPGKNAFL